MYRESNGIWAGMVVAVALLGTAPQPHPGVASTVNVKLTEWTVAVLAGKGEPLEFDGMTFHTVERSPLERSKAAGRYIVKTILAPRDEAIDLLGLYRCTRAVGREGSAFAAMFAGPGGARFSVQRSAAGRSAAFVVRRFEFCAGAGNQYQPKTLCVPHENAECHAARPPEQTGNGRGSETNSQRIDRPA